MADESPPPTLSRYRSQRRKDPLVADGTPIDDNPPAADGPNRSRSRYHRKPGSSGGPTTGLGRPESQRVDGAAPRFQNRQPEPRSTPPVTAASSGQEPRQKQEWPTRGSSSAPRGQPMPQIERGISDHGRAPGRDRPLPHADTSTQLPNAANGSHQRAEPASATALKSQTQVKQTPSGGLFPPPKPMEQVIRADGPRQGTATPPDRVRLTKSMRDLRASDDDELEAGCLGLFKRKRSGTPRPVTEKPPMISEVARSDGRPMAVKPPTELRGTDAPVSAVNAGDRHVLVECGRTKTLFPITPATTPVDLIESAAASMSERIDKRASVLVESFGPVGIQRALRQYECIRDVMNSWDNDRQNSLLLVDPGTGNPEEELCFSGASQERPDEGSWLLAYSQKVGKWDTRWITLKSDGQITCAKDPEKPRDAINVCHLSDFDIYTPTPEKVKKKIRPPKKHCFAIKSQQKSSMFESTHSFVHFFSTGDRACADSFYRAVQSWRSWYLVNVLGEGRTSQAADTADEKIRQGPLIDPGAARRTKESVGSQYQLGSFNPPLNADPPDRAPHPSRFHNTLPSAPEALPTNTNGIDPNVQPPRRTTSVRRSPPNGLPTHKAVLSEDEPLVNFNIRASMERRRASIDRERTESQEFSAAVPSGRPLATRDSVRQQPLAPGTDALNRGVESGGNEPRRDSRPGDDLRRFGSVSRRNPLDSDKRQSGYSPDGATTRRSPPTDLRRSSSRAQREMPKPLIDLTPQYREPPQHARKGRAVVPTDPIGAGGLVESATSPDDPLRIPSSVEWRQKRPPSNPPAGAGVNRTSSVSRPGTRAKRPSASEPFTGDGLLAGPQAQQGWGSGGRGRGVMDGTRAGGRPMMDLAEPSKFTDGSLLNRVERDRGGPGPQAPALERERGDARGLKYGEMF